MDSNDRRLSGALGERLAAWFLERRGFRVIERNVRIGRFEVDLVVGRNDLLVLVEVKRRSSGAWQRACATLSGAQRRRLAAAAEAYAARHAAGRRVRYDVVTIDEDETRLVIEHHADALGAGGGLR